MIGVCVWSKKNKKKVKVLAQYSDSEEDLAIETAKSLAQHNRGEVLVCLITRKKYRILHKVRVGWHLAFPTLRHPFRLPSRGVNVR